ncbi:MAG: patatin [candidate division Zixibacteria bacterium]|nr:patatin [candidate division Zixibacteria bacterium]
MPGTALVLSGGGAKGAFQIGAERYAREVCGYRWDVIAGVSVGALNAAMLGAGRPERLHDIWQNITNEQVYTGTLNVWTALKLLLGSRRAVYDNTPLQQLVERELRDVSFPSHMHVRVGAVSLLTGEYAIFTPHDPAFIRAVIASATMPIVWPPLDVSDTWPQMVDGGLRNISPLGDVLDFDPDDVVIINCSPRQPSSLDEAPRNIIDVAKRALLDIALNEIFVTDLREFLRINELVGQAERVGVILRKRDGRPYRHYRCHIIEPAEPLGDTLDFSSRSIRRSMAAGWEMAKSVLGSLGAPSPSSVWVMGNR